jgi:hypothetical protein
LDSTYRSRSNFFFFHAREGFLPNPLLIHFSNTQKNSRPPTLDFYFEIANTMTCLETSDDYAPSSTEETLYTLAAMRQQEESGYMTCDYLHQQQFESPAVPNGPLDRVDVDCRNKMSAWCYQVVDFCKFNRETVSISMSYLDRYLMSPTGAAALADRKLFQLAAMTCLYTAVKIHEPEAMDPKLVSSLSRGTYNKAQIEEMEASILGALQWRMNPPTSLAFARMFLELIPDDVLCRTYRDTVYDLIKYQTELAVGDYNFVTTKASTIAFCALLNSLESVSLDMKVSAQISFVLSTAIDVDARDQVLVQVQTYLYQAILQHPSALNNFSTPTVSTAKASRRLSVEVSPQSISAIR